MNQQNVILLIAFRNEELDEKHNKNLNFSIGLVAIIT